MNIFIPIHIFGPAGPDLSKCNIFRNTQNWLFVGANIYIRQYSYITCASSDTSERRTSLYKNKAVTSSAASCYTSRPFSAAPQRTAKVLERARNFTKAVQSWGSFQSRQIWGHCPALNTWAVLNVDATHRAKLIRQRAMAKSSLTRTQSFIEAGDRKLNDIKSRLMNCQKYTTNLKLHRVS